jgi:FkbM family methyltransferase
MKFYEAPRAQGKILMSVSIARRIMEVALGPLVIKRRLPAGAGGGLVVVSGKVGGLKYLLKRSRHWDPELLNIADLLITRGHSVWDVGANVGLFSQAAAFHAGAEGKILSIEADIDAVTLLNRTCRYRMPDHAVVTILPVAVSSSVGFVRFAIAKRARASNSIEGFGSTQTGGIKETRTLPCVTLDSLLEHFRAPDVLKIDVEEAELEVLRSAELVLIQSRPIIYCEVSTKTRLEVEKLLRDRAYRLWDGRGFDGALRGAGISDQTINLVAIPEERIDIFLHQNHLT